MGRCVALRLRKLPVVHWFCEPTLLPLPGQEVIVRTQAGRELATVLETLPEGKDKSEATDSFIKEIIRPVDDQDREAICSLHDREIKAFKTAGEKIQEQKLPMKLLKAEYLFDQSRLIFYYKAETKVDFRELLKVLSSLFKIRIELRQIGVRDETKLLGGIGCCGKVVCCRQFINKFCPVSTKMAKDQNMSLNPVKLSGICGRLLCCLSYEYNYYSEFHGKFPKIGSEIVIGSEKARVTDINYILQKLFVGFLDRRKANFPFSFVRVRKEAGSGRNLWWIQGPDDIEPDLSLLAQPSKLREVEGESNPSASGQRKQGIEKESNKGKNCARSRSTKIESDVTRASQDSPDSIEIPLENETNEDPVNKDSDESKENGTLS
ncbi:stage 0 sporulation protein [bacterium]|nr:stage 0 sporulation protein [bacterium]